MERPLLPFGQITDRGWVATTASRFQAPLTRRRSDANGVPPRMAAEYYARRACAGLIITEATAISPLVHGYWGVPGIYSKTQIERWQQITQAVHARFG